jgi:hypothetical protein
VNLILIFDDVGRLHCYPDEMVRCERGIVRSASVEVKAAGIIFYQRGYRKVNGNGAN